MEKIRTNNNTKESGIALVITLVITLVAFLLIGGLTYLFKIGFQTNIMYRQFATVYEAANGGVEYTAGVVWEAVNLGSGSLPTNLGGVLPDETTLSGIIHSCTANTATIATKTADGNYNILVTLRCLDSKALPGYGGGLAFPPPPPMASGGIGAAQRYFFYSIIADATETSSSVIGRTEAIYRLIK